jgi:beta-lactamase class A
MIDEKYNGRYHYHNYILKRKRRKIFFRRIRYVSVFLVLSLIGFLLHNLASMAFSPKDPPPQANNLANPRDSASPKAVASQTGQEKLAQLQSEISDYLKNYQGEYGVYYYNLANGEEFGINDEDEFPAASTIKIPLNLYLFNRIKSGAVNQESTLTYLPSDYEDGTGEIQYQTVGAKYSIKDLSRLSIEESDNVAANMLIRFLGIQNIYDFMRQAGGRVVIDGQNVSSPKDMGLYMKLVYIFCETGGALGDELMNSFLNTRFNDRIPALLPKQVKVANKIGTELHAVNDVGIVFTGKPYIISIMSKNVKDAEAPDVIAHISKMVYDSVGQQ